MNMMRDTFRRSPTIACSCGTITALIGDGWESFYQTITNARELGDHHPFDLSFEALNVKVGVSDCYPQCHQFLLAHIAEPDKTFMAMTSVVRFILDRNRHGGVAPYVRRFQAGGYHFFEMGCRHGVYLCGHPIEIDAYRSKLPEMANMLDFLADMWEVSITPAFIADPAKADHVCKDLKLLFC
jgi:hypothetical protein